MDPFFYLCFTFVFIIYTVLSVSCNLVIFCWERDALLAILCDVSLCFVFGQAHSGLIVGFLMLWFKVVCILESSSLFYLLFNILICICIDKLEIFLSNQTYTCLDPHQN